VGKLVFLVFAKNIFRQSKGINNVLMPFDCRPSITDGTDKNKMFEIQLSLNMIYIIILP
jgi:hypothetical protein